MNTQRAQGIDNFVLFVILDFVSFVVKEINLFSEFVS
jgi:hypothetical protein